MNSRLVDIIANGEWVWPDQWNSKFPNAIVPSIDVHTPDKLWWRDINGTFNEFLVGVAWNGIRPREAEVVWASVVWFANCIPRHAFILGLVFKRKLKTQDVLRQWDVHGSNNLALLCPLCDLQQDSHEHLFFECMFSSQVWSSVKTKAGLHLVSDVWSSIVNGILPFANKRSINSVVARLVLAASVYYVWQERNSRLFKQKKKSKEQVVDLILATARLKLLSFCFKKSSRVDKVMAEWDLTCSLIM